MDTVSVPVPVRDTRSNTSNRTCDRSVVTSGPTTDRKWLLFHGIITLAVSGTGTGHLRAIEIPLIETHHLNLKQFQDLKNW